MAEFTNYVLVVRNSANPWFEVRRAVTDPLLGSIESVPVIGEGSDLTHVLWYAARREGCAIAFPMKEAPV